MSVRRILESFATWRARGEPLVLATVYETAGSTYSKAGHRILIAANGDYQGLVSGGCLEGDLAERARRVLETNEPAPAVYDLRDEADELWGLGIGCNGLLRVFLQPLRPEEGFQPFAAIAERLRQRGPAAIATVIDPGAGLAPGATVVAGRDDVELFRLEAAAAEALVSGCREALASGRAAYRRDASGLGVLYAPLKPVPRLLVLGAGLDAVPLVQMAAELGWLVGVADHRRGYVARGGFERAEWVRCIEPARLHEQVPLGEFDAIVVMSHHLATDRTYLAQLASADAAYLGVLGPAARKERLLAELGEVGERLRPRLKGPVGLDIGADSPESIALSILAELQTVLAGAALRRAAPD
ncbi:MAG TPA: XdhC family protein [Gammaproteobacteria bacterium]